jgi:putative membrane protein
MFRIPRNLLLTLAVSGVMVLPGYAQTGSGNSQYGQTSTPPAATANTNFTTADQHFLRQAAQTDIAEIRMAKLANTKSETAEVKDLANKMIQQHSQNLRQVRQLAAENGFQLPNVPSAQQREQITQLRGLSGRDFDREYTQLQVQDHQAAIRNFRKAADRTTNPALKDYIARTLPVLGEHREMAMQAYKNAQNAPILGRLGGGTGGAGSH